jgi:DNA-binding FadR family transcriptional regulator
LTRQIACLSYKYVAWPDHERVRLRKLPEQVARTLGRRLVYRAAEAPLPSEQDICIEFAVSRTVAREALSILESLDLIHISQGRRIVMRPRHDWDFLSPLLMDLLEPRELARVLADLHETRLILEPEVAARAATRMSPEGDELMGQALARMRQLEHDPDGYLEHDLGFHMELCRHCDNLVLDRILRACRWLLIASRRVTNLLPDGLVIATQGHEAILDAVRARDPERARAAMTEHLHLVTRVWLEEESPVEAVFDGPLASARDALRDQKAMP